MHLCGSAIVVVVVVVLVCEISHTNIECAVMKREWVEEANAINRTEFYNFFYYLHLLVIVFLHPCSFRCLSFKHESLAFAAYTLAVFNIALRYIYKLQWHIKCGEWRSGIFIVWIVYFIIIILTIFVDAAVFVYIVCVPRIVLLTTLSCFVFNQLSARAFTVHFDWL